MFTTFSLIAFSIAPATQPSQTPLTRELWTDLDGDGLQDLYVLTPGATDRLFRNQGDGTFVDVTQESGLGQHRATQAFWQDVDGDDRQDLLLVDDRAALHLYRSVGDLSFEKSTEAAGLSGVQGVRDALWMDFDRDGQIDLRLRTAQGLVLLRQHNAMDFQPVTLNLPSADSTAPVTSNDVDSTNPVGEGPATPDTHGSRTILTGSSGSSSAQSGGSFGNQSTSSQRTQISTSGPSAGAASSWDYCPDSITDQATGTCGVQASSIPLLGSLYPLSNEFFVDAGTGNVGLGTTSPGAPFTMDNGLFPVGIGQGILGGTATMELLTTDSSGDLTPRFVMGGGSNGDTADIEFYTGAFGAEVQTLVISGDDQNVGIGVSEPEETLDVAGNAKFSGGVQSGSGTETTDAPDMRFSGDTMGDYIGLVHRRAISRENTDGNVVAITSDFRLERDGTNGGLRIVWEPTQASPRDLIGTYVDGSGVVHGIYEKFFSTEMAAGGSRTILTNADDAKMFHIMFGWPYQGSKHSELRMFRDGNDYCWLGSLTSSTDQ